tara:strand:- start:52 stop:396 length:345 start_codon:yes stop_codon:yes gene_type:complete
MLPEHLRSWPIEVDDDGVATELVYRSQIFVEGQAEPCGVVGFGGNKERPNIRITSFRNRIKLENQRDTSFPCVKFSLEEARVLAEMLNHALAHSVEDEFGDGCPVMPDYNEWVQ